MSAPATRKPLAEALAAAAAEAEKPAAEQLTMLPPSPFGLGTGRQRVMAEHIARDRRGRPAGAQNLATRDVIAFVRQVFGDPVLERARWAAHTPATLAKVLNCTELEAFDRLDKIRADLTLLIYPRLAPVDGQGNAVVPTFNMMIGGSQTGAGGDLPPWEYLKNLTGQVIENTPLSRPALPVSDGSASDDEAK